MFKKKIETPERMMARFVEAIVYLLVQEFSASLIRKQCNMFGLYNNEKQFSNFLFALHATDARFYQASRPHGN